MFRELKLYLRKLRCSVFPYLASTVCFTLLPCAHIDKQEPISCFKLRTHTSIFYCENCVSVLSLSFRTLTLRAIEVCDPESHPVVSFGRIKFGLRLGTLKHDGVLVVSTHLTVSARRGRERFEQLSVVFYLAQRKLHIHAISFRTILMTAWICWYKHFWVRRGESIQKPYLEEW